jgi:hypothetical protein
LIKIKETALNFTCVVSFFLIIEFPFVDEMYGFEMMYMCIENHASIFIEVTLLDFLSEGWQEQLTFSVD